VAQANLALEAELYKHLNANRPDDEPDHPDDVDFREANSLFREALDLDGNNLTARFGVAITDLLVLSVDTEINAAFDEWEEYLDDRVPFEVDDGDEGPMGIPIAPTRGASALALPFDVIPLSIAAKTRPAIFAVDPDVDRVLQILEDQVLPPLNSAVGHLSAVGAEPTFMYTVTGRMQGDEDEESVEIDQTDVVALRAAAHLLIAAIDVALAYEVNIADYDSANMFAALAPGSTFGALKPIDGAARLQSAHDEISLAIDDVEMAMDLLLAESDSQTDDVIKIGPRDIVQADFDSIRANIANARAGLTSSGYTRIDDWDDDNDTPPVALTVSAGAFFLTPIQDLKALAPAYSVRIERRVLDTDSERMSGETNAEVTVGVAGSYFGSRYVYTDDGDEDGSYSGDAALRDVLESVVQTRLAIARSDPNFADFSGSASFSGQLSGGANAIIVSWNETVEIATSYIYVPVIDWEADTFAQWQWPNPSFGGILPSIASSEQFLSTFGIDEDDWDPEVVIDLSRLGKRGATGSGTRSEAHSPLR